MATPGTVTRCGPITVAMSRIGRFLLRITVALVAFYLQRAMDEAEREQRIRKRYRTVIRTNWLGFTSVEYIER